MVFPIQWEYKSIILQTLRLNYTCLQFLKGKIVQMIKQSQLQEALKQNFPQFNSKESLISYYMSFDFPQKQMKLVVWWQKVIEFIIQKTSRIYITYSELVSYVTIYNLKPTPLQAIISFLAKKTAFVPEDQFLNKNLKEGDNAKQGKSWIGSLLPFWNKAEKEKEIFTFVPSEKIFSKKLKQYKKKEILYILPSIFQHVNSIDEFKFIKQLQFRCRLDQLSIKQILKELQDENLALLIEKGNKRFIIFTPNQNDINSKQWRDIETMKFCLREQVDKFQTMISLQQGKISILNKRARELAQNNNKNSAKAALREIIEKDKKIISIRSRKSLLQNQITQLQFNEMNKSTMLLLEESNKVYQQTEIDSIKLEQIMQKNKEIQISHKETNQMIEGMANDEDADEVDQLFQKLNREVISEKAKYVEKKNVEVNIKKVEQPMDIEEPNSIHYS